MPYGWAGEILYVDLTKKKISRISTAKYSRMFIGGRGINSKFIYDMVSPKTDPYDPMNVLMFGTGPLTGTSAPSSSRVDIAAKSPVTGLMGMSNIGGFWGAELKFAGYDNVAIIGKADKPVYLWVDDDNIEIRNAAHLWGLDTFQVQESLWKELADPDAKIICIGPGGENKVSFASVIHELGDGAGRTGMGAVMGSKNLKAIAVRGTKPVKVAKPEEFLESCEKMHELIRNSWMYDFLSKHGFNMDMIAYEIISLGGIYNKQREHWDKIDSPSWQQLPYEEKYSVGTRACFGCPVGCMQFISLPGIGNCLQSCQGYTELREGIGNADSKLMGEAFRRCEMNGIDLLSTSHTIQWAIELYQRGILTQQDTEGIPLKWGDRNTIMTMIEKIAKREGFGGILADGPLKASKEIGKGSEYYVMHTKGLTHFDVDLRAHKMWALVTATGPRGDLIRSNPNFEYIGEFLTEEKDKQYFQNRVLNITGTLKTTIPTEYDHKAKAVVWMEHENITNDLVGICKWVCAWNILMPLTSKEHSELLSKCTGIDINNVELLKAAERVRNIERIFDAKEGLTRKDDTLPKRYFKEPLPDGRYKGEILDKEKFEKMKDEYYQLKGWDFETGLPTEKKLEELDLNEIIEDLRKIRNMNKA